MQSGSYTYNLRSDGTAEIVGYVDRGEDRLLTLPESLDGYPVTAIGERAFYRCKFLTKVIFPDGAADDWKLLFPQLQSSD